MSRKTNTIIEYTGNMDDENIEETNNSIEGTFTGRYNGFNENTDINYDEDNIFDTDMIETTVTDYNPMKNLKKKIPWVDKYRPKKLSEIIHQEEVIKVLRKCLETGQFTHMLFYGPPGSGKTSTILSFVNELYGPNIIDQRVIELNASDERGINVVRNKIISFAKTSIGNKDPKYPSPPFKIIILDEADAMTTEAQSALRTIMETMSEITRFCFVCNYISQIIDPIASRCVKFRFQLINDVAMSNKLITIAKNENFTISTDIIDKIVEIAKGDVRHGIMTLQYLKYIYDYKGPISMNDLYQTTNYLPYEEIATLWDRCIAPSNSTIKTIREEITILKEKGYSIHSIINQIKNVVVKNTIMPDLKKSEICIVLSSIEKMLVDGADEYLQLLYLFVSIHGIYRKKIQ
ncbi:MAG: replication factor C small subunit [Terrestrivirus sp.]|uniref:Replication factor C small subunit n=1 Tax=Terrestrivirus sp. TaxID=2487775 RepID=A0A3G4ZNK8_9VIRU|nr:MAG: replication factor C small subunit [Terrestrivirus sp.]